MTLTKSRPGTRGIQKIIRNSPRQRRPNQSRPLSVVQAVLIDGSDLLLSGFGKFNVKEKNARRGRNPQTGNELILGPRRVVTFKPSGILREKINS